MEVTQTRILKHSIDVCPSPNPHALYMYVRYGLLILSRDTQFKDVTLVDCHLKTDATEDTRACNMCFRLEIGCPHIQISRRIITKKSFVWNEGVRTPKFQTKYVLVQIYVEKFACGQAETRRKKIQKNIMGR